jgi:hypothetical protein
VTSRRHEFTAEETADLLDELDTRLRRRGVTASIFVVGGAAIAANHTRRDRVTEDVEEVSDLLCKQWSPSLRGHCYHHDHDGQHGAR